MGRFVKILTEVEATSWFANGDHPGDGPADSEGKVVRYFRRPDVPGDSLCGRCDCVMHGHGWIDTPAGGHVVCPGDWIISAGGGEYYPIPALAFRSAYAPAGGRPYVEREGGLRRFVLLRDVDVTGVSGEGLVVWGVEYPDGVCAYRWNSPHKTTCVADCIRDIETIHGHDGRTRVVWLDSPQTARTALESVHERPAP
jgi:hypothetical protein